MHAAGLAAGLGTFTVCGFFILLRSTDSSTFVFATNSSQSIRHNACLASACECPANTNFCTMRFFDAHQSNSHTDKPRRPYPRLNSSARGWTLGNEHAEPCLGGTLNGNPRCCTRRHGLQYAARMIVISLRHPRRVEAICGKQNNRALRGTAGKLGFRHNKPRWPDVDHASTQQPSGRSGSSLRPTWAGRPVPFVFRPVGYQLIDSIVATRR